MASLRLRFKFNQQRGSASSGIGGTRGADNFSRVIIEDVAFSYSEHLFAKLKRDVERRLKADVMAELEHISRLFMSGVVGIAGRNRGATGIMTSRAPKADNFGLSLYEPVRSHSGQWARRSADYLAWRAKKDWRSAGERRGDKGSDPAWFRRNSPSVLDRLRATGTWTGAFGGISVTLKRHTSLGPRDVAARGFETRLSGTRGGNARVGVANIRVEAMRRITVGMLPAVGGGRLGDFGASPRSSGLLSLLGDDIAHRLGGNPETVPFRPTIQPFLGFFLTRQLPNAVFRRIEQGLGGRLHDGVGSGGRVSKNQVQGRNLSLSDYMPRR